MNPFLYKLKVVLAAAWLCMAGVYMPAAAATTELSDIPMVNATTAVILPNIMLDLDNSGSMSFDFMPDYVRYASGSFPKWCRGTDSNNTLVVCEHGDPPYYASNFNGLYYNPDVRYAWPVQADGTLKPDHQTKTSYVSPWDKVASDGYGIQANDNSSAQTPTTGSSCNPNALGGNNTCSEYTKLQTVNLVTSYPERVWCNNSNANVNNTSDCRSAVDASNNYIYPNNTYRHLKVRYGAPFYYKVNVEWCSSASNNGTYRNYGVAGTCQAKKTATHRYVHFYNWSRVDIKPTTSFGTKAAARTDCAGTSCTYAEEMSNFANWFAWYRSRMQMTKSAIGHAFKDVRGTPKTGAALTADPDDENFLHARVGLTTINNPVVLNIANFDAAQKTAFYTQLYKLVPSGGTPLRTSLNSIGKMYEGTSTTYSDPVQYSCQKNFAILATDGYWNDSFSSIGNVDNNLSEVKRPTYDGGSTVNASNTLADVAYYYYKTDLRPNMTDNVSPSGTNPDVDDTAQHQHMTTFTIGLGLDGSLTYDPSYRTSTSGDYFDIRQGTKNWPKPAADTQETIDDLWHAAVNGRGVYFSTQDPSALEEGLKKTLMSIDSKTGAGAAAAASSLQLQTGDNFIYLATYRTTKWDGQVAAYKITPSTGAIASTAQWQADTELNSKVAAAGDSDTRTIYTADGTTRTLFKKVDGTEGLTATQLAYFDNTKLTQYADWSASDKAVATAERLVNYLRGHNRYEDQDRPDNYGSYTKLYRDREKILGDIVHSQPVYVQMSKFNFKHDDYSTFRSGTEDRLPTLYVAANDGMLHAFDAQTGKERWAYVPPMILPELWRLANSDYATDHRFYLDGPLSVSDAYINGSWKTILIGALGKGGRGYYALDITDPTDPKPLWNFTPDTAKTDGNVGYSYGSALTAMLKDGSWVAVIPSGYNNVPEGSKYPDADGQGRLFVLDLATGNVKKTINTGVGSVTNPSGLAHINIYIEDINVSKTAAGAYGGDLLGNMWRFDLEAGTATKLAALGAGKPIAVRPEIAEVERKNVLFFGSGRYLGETDLKDTSLQTMYAIMDDGTTTVTDPASQLVKQTVTTSGVSRSISNQAVDWTTDLGWYFDFADSGERLTINPQLYEGTLIFSTTVPTASECQPGGYGWLYMVDYLTGGNINNIAAGTRVTSPIVGITILTTDAGTPIVQTVPGDGSRPDPRTVPIKPQTGAGTVKRVLWRELID